MHPKFSELLETLSLPPIASRADVTSAHVRALFAYQPLTGHLYRRHRSSRCIDIGQPAGHTQADGYIRIYLANHSWKAHNLVWALFHDTPPNGFMIDHVNRIKNDNRIQNLRLATSAQNSFNSAVYCTNTSGYRGVHFHKASQKYLAYIYSNNKRIDIGRFDSALEAHEARRESLPSIHPDCIEFINSQP
jgi:hypothetical protein